MRIRPKKFSQRSDKTLRPAAFCQNPGCGAKLSAVQTRRGGKYCDRVCQLEHGRLLKLERRPKDLMCSNPRCGKPLDPLSKGPRDWKKKDMHFCDSICYDEYSRVTGRYVTIAQKGVEASQAYHDKHGHMHNYEDRAQAVRENNTKAPPKAKYFVRRGKVWGYDVTSYPNEDGDGYRLSIAELPELGIVQAKTHKEGLRLMRTRFLEHRDIVREKQEEQEAEKLFDAVDEHLSDEEFVALYNALKAGVDPRRVLGYQKAEKLFTEKYGTCIPKTIETAFDRAMERRFQRDA